jgi:hypothetical protein
MSNEQPQQIALDPTNPAHAIEIIDQMLQPKFFNQGAFSRQDWGMAEVCVRSLRKKATETPVENS